MAPAAAGELEAAPGDPLDLVRPVLHRVEDGAVLAHAARAVVEPADQLADDEQVDLAAACRAEVRIDVELAPKADQSVLRADVGAVELGRADRSHEHGIGGAGRGQRLRGERVAGRVDGGAAEEVLLQLQLERELPRTAAAAAATSGPMPSPGRRAIFTATRGR